MTITQSVWAHAVITHDYLYDEFGDDDVTGETIDYLGDEVNEFGLQPAVECKAYDDDDILYFDLAVHLPAYTRFAETCALDSLLYKLGRGWGVTRISFPGHPELDCS